MRPLRGDLPAAVRALVLYGTYAKRSHPDDDYPWAPTWERAGRATRASSRRRGARTSTSRRWRRTPTTRCARWFQRRGRAALSPAGARDLILMNSKADVRDVLASVQCPTLVLHRAGDRDSQVEEGRYIADRIPGRPLRRARAATTTCRSSIPDQIIDEVEEFLTGVRPVAGDGPRARHDPLHRPRRLDRARRGARGRRLGVAARTSQRRGAARARRFSGGGDRHGGRRVPRALRRAGAGDPLRPRDPRRAARLGLDVRAGVHTGEVERPSGRKPRGIAVHVGARVMSLGERGRGARQRRRRTTSSRAPASSSRTAASTS